MHGLRFTIRLLVGVEICNRWHPRNFSWSTLFTFSLIKLPTMKFRPLQTFFWQFVHSCISSADHITVVSQMLRLLGVFTLQTAHSFQRNMLETKFFPQCYHKTAYLCICPERLGSLDGCGSSWWASSVHSALVMYTVCAVSAADSNLCTMFPSESHVDRGDGSRARIILEAQGHRCI